MQRKIFLLAAILVFALVGTATALAGGTGEQKTVIRLKAGDFELAKTDLSHLGLGESETIVTDSGKTIDLLRTAEGVEIYIDGERLDFGMHGEELGHGEHGATHRRIKVICADDENCEKHVLLGHAADADPGALHAEDGEHVIIRKRIEIECEEGDECEAFEIETLGDSGDAHGVLMIHGDGDHEMEILEQAGDVIHEDGHHRKVYVIRKED